MSEPQFIHLRQIIGIKPLALPMDFSDNIQQENQSKTIYSIEKAILPRASRRGNKRLCQE
ncbi:hypothetical protein [Mucilaginibacter psychrotolerans]|uniref:Uncharacterized protein n=1 Tax=Mucilaginibacter psychrotolerans TaxID=1524096 RepID=A0A4Y8SMF8_9SPHI|nr:hypothetical protein [Mucilaginibacter psychrotolerans]TFF40243.1 hypothetical protein E2R66_03045 [Mucilaginibacter psychrotolerans]